MKSFRISLRNVAISFACLAAVTVIFASCDDGGEENDAMLTGQVFITPAGPVAVGNMPVAVYTEGEIES